MKSNTLILGLVFVAASGMAQAATHEHDMSQHQMAMQTASSEIGHEGIGILKAVNAKAGKVQISHEPIASLNWPAMTMWFALRAPLSQNIKVGDTVRFELTQGENNKWMISKIERK